MSHTQLYRICYVREGRPRSVTFAARDAVAAAEWSRTWERVSGSPVLTVQPLGPSRFPERPYARLHARLATLTPEEAFQEEVSRGLR